MSYLDHFGLSVPPFALTPDPKFWFESGTHKKAMAYLGYGFQQAEGFIVVTGEVGAGKTTLVGLLMERHKAAVYGYLLRLTGRRDAADVRLQKINLAPRLGEASEMPCRLLALGHVNMPTDVVFRR